MMEPEAESVVEPTGGQRKEVRRRKKQLYSALRRQMEFYFSDANLTKNRIMGQRVLEDPNVDLSLFLTFNLIRALTMNVDDIVNALKESEMLAVTEDGTKVYRTTPVRENDNVDECTIYVENLPPDAEHEWLKSVFQPFGNVPYVSIPKFNVSRTNKGFAYGDMPYGSIPKFNVSRMNKGFAFVELESPDAVNRALEAFAARGCLIPTQMPHEQLSSIANYDEKPPEEREAVVKEVVDMFRDEPAAGKDGENVEIKMEMDDDLIKHDKMENEDDSEEKVSKKKKLKENGEDNEEKSSKKKKKVKDNEEEEEEKSKSSNKRKREEDVEQGSKDESEIAKHPKRRKSKTEKETDVVKTESKEVEVDEAVEGDEKENEVECEEGEEERKKKKSRKHKKKNKKEVEETDPMKSLRILPKLEWKRLRNKYLSLQKSKMMELKQHLSRSRWGGNYSQEPRDHHSGPPKQGEENEQEKPAQGEPAKRFSFVPGVIVSIRTDEPIGDVKAFKTEARSHNNVLYVDLDDGSTEAFVRCSTSDDALALLTKRPWANMSILEGQAETDYWEKISKDREQKMKGTWTSQPKKRGRYKLLKKAEKALGKHIRFDEHE